MACNCNCGERCCRRAELEQKVIATGEALRKRYKIETALWQEIRPFCEAVDALIASSVKTWTAREDAIVERNDGRRIWLSGISNEADAILVAEALTLLEKHKAEKASWASFSGPSEPLAGWCVPLALALAGACPPYWRRCTASETNSAQ